MNTRIRQTLASMFSAAAVMFAVPLAASAQDSAQAPMVVRVSSDAALARQTREAMRAAGVANARAHVLVVQRSADARR